MSIANKLRIGKDLSRLKVNKFIDKNCDQETFLRNIIRFAVRTRIWVHQNLESYETRVVTRKRLIQCYLFRLCLVINFLRFVAAAVFPTKWMLHLVFCPIYKVFDSSTPPDHLLVRVTTLVYSEGPLIIVILIVMLQTMELNYTNTIYNFIVDLLSKRHLPLSFSHSKRLGVIAWLLNKVLLEVTFVPLVIISLIYHLNANIYTYEDTDSRLYLINLFLSNLFFLTFLVQFFAYIFVALCGFIFTVIYLRYKFIEMNHSFYLSLKLKHLSHMTHISKHYILCILTRDLNQIYSMIIFVLYYLATPGLMVMIMVLTVDQFTLSGKIMNFILVTVIFGANFTLNLISCRVSKSSRLPLNYLHRYMAENKLKTRQKFKVNVIHRTFEWTRHWILLSRLIPNEFL